MFHLHDLLCQKKQESHWISLDPTRGIEPALMRPSDSLSRHGLLCQLQCLVAAIEINSISILLENSYERKFLSLY